MTALSCQSRLARAAVSPTRGFGEPVLLPAANEGEDPVELTGIFDPLGDASGEAFGSEVGLVGRLSGQPNPLLWLREADAAAVAEGATVQIRGGSYRAVRQDPDGAGLVRYELMPAARGSADTEARYR